MGERHRRSDLHAAPLEPGQLVRTFAERSGWKCKLRNIMVEGTLDTAYFEHADKVFTKKHGKRLIDDDLAIFACGAREKGGVWSLEDKFRALANVIVADPKDEHGREFRVIALFDDDHAGRERFNAITAGRHSLWRPYVHAFLLKRRFPPPHPTPADFRRELDVLNAAWTGFDCEIEDLVGRNVLQDFVNATPSCLERQPTLSADGIGHHYDWHRWAKNRLIYFVQSRAAFEDVQLTIELLRALRALLQLSPDGT